MKKRLTNQFSSFIVSLMLKSFILSLLQAIFAGALFASPVIAQELDKQTVDFTTNQISFKEALNTIERNTSFRFFYTSNQLILNQNISISKKSYSVREILKSIAAQTHTAYHVNKYSIAVTPFQHTGLLKPVITEEVKNLTFSGAIRGKIIDANTKEPLPGASVQIKGTSKGSLSDINGEFLITGLTSGPATIIVSFIGYESYVLTLTIGDGEQKINVSLKPSSTSLNEVVVEAKRITNTEQSVLLDRKNSVVIQDAISAQAIERTASITTTQALLKVPGLSVRDDKFVSIRGLTDRNIVAQLNGARLSSSDPTRSSVPLDLVPAQLLDNITVQKTITPDKPGDATAGIIELKTKSIPDSLVISVTAQAGFNDAVGFGGNNYITSYQNGGLGFFGQNVRSHRLSDEFLALTGQYSGPGTNGFYLRNGEKTPFASNELRAYNNISDVIANSRDGNYKDAEAQRINRVMESVDPVLTTSKRKVPINQLYNIYIGNKYKVFGKDLGVIVGLNYYHRSQQYSNGENNRYSITEPIRPADPSGNPYDPLSNIVTPNRLRLLRRFSYNENTGTETVSYGALAALSFRINTKNEVSMHYVGNRGAESSGTQLIGSNNQALRGLDASNSNDITSSRLANYQYALRATERNFNTLQFRGIHKFPFFWSEKLLLNWNLSGSRSTNEDPDLRNAFLTVDSAAVTKFGGIVYKPVKRPDGFGFFAEADRYWRKLVEDNRNYTIDLTIPIKVSGFLFSAKIGGYYLKRERTFTESINVLSSKDEGFSDNGPAAEEKYLKLAGLDINSLGGDLNKWVGPQSVGIIENKGSSEGEPFSVGRLYNAAKSGNDYKISSNVTAFYGMLDIPVLKTLRISGGMRVEGTNIQGLRDTSNNTLANNIVNNRDYRFNYVVDLKQYQFLPSGTIIYNFNPLINFRLSYSKTLARPELGELPRISIYDASQQAYIRGNPLIKNASYQNFDMRIEWFPKSDEVLAASFFYKTADDVIEKVYAPAGQVGQDVPRPQATFIDFRNNPNSGKVYGVEFEVRKNLETFTSALSHFYVGLNLFLARSSTKLPSNELNVLQRFDRGIKETRPLFEQPNYGFNASFGYDNPDKGTSINTYFNATGERLVEINVDGTPNVFERPAPQFDFIFSQRLIKRLVLKGFVKNILDSPSKWLYTKAGDHGKYGYLNETYTRRSFTRGREISLGFTYQF